MAFQAVQATAGVPLIISHMCLSIHRLDFTTRVLDSQRSWGPNLIIVRPSFLQNAPLPKAPRLRCPDDLPASPQAEQMDPLTSTAIAVSAFSFVLDILVCYRQLHKKPWDPELPISDCEALKEEGLQASDTIISPILPPSTDSDENSPLNATSTVTYDTISEKDTTSAEIVDTTPSPPAEWPPADAPKWFWFFGTDHSRYFLSPAERGPIFSKWYHGFRVLLPIFVQRYVLVPRKNPNAPKPHPQAETSGMLCAGLIAMKFALGIPVALLLFVEQKEGEKGFGGFTKVVLLIEAWAILLVILFNNKIYWRSNRRSDTLSNNLLARCRLLLPAVATTAMWWGVWTSKGWDPAIFRIEGLPFAIFVGMSYGITYERLV